ncbi:uncharacterized protein LOC6550697 [Drosophila erecta]|uniref:CHCH domain-containing protein n=1 Tax=Drosophila erecta TaxID=7220 RepID=B3NUU0_DROER|nr:uncharacterized protein LOC6550697 [Drosophila erecta]EDV47038.1 uncharacterized protein Dere_GG19414 [Drosophila erecta]
MGAQLAGESRAEGGAGAGAGAGAGPHPPQGQESATEKAEKTQSELPGQPNQEQEGGRPNQKAEHPQPMPVSGRHTRSRSITADIQRMPTELIYAEFDRLIQQVELHVGQVAAEPPCLDVAARLQSCLQAHPQRSCNCFAAMEEYRHCVLRATQNRVDDLADMEPPTMTVVPPKAMPPPAVPPPSARGNRRWWKFWTWFR